jgi:DNA mismatch repair protein MutL
MEFGELPSPVREEERESRDEYIPEALWQIHNAYIVAQVKSGVIVLDQHAAHERVIYEQLKSHKAKSQSLLFPIMVSLKPALHTVFTENQAILESIGFKFSALSGRTLVVEALPDVFETLTKEEFGEILEELSENRALPDRFQSILKVIACKAAVKFGESLSTEEMNALVDRLFACETPYFCPHGRPTVIRMTLEELGKRFGR